MNSVVHEENQLYSELASILLSVAPADWRSITLNLQYKAAESERFAIAHRMGNGNNTTLLQIPPESLYAKTLELFNLFRQKGQPWRGATYRLDWVEAEDSWEMAVQYAW